HSQKGHGARWRRPPVAAEPRTLPAHPQQRPLGREERRLERTGAVDHAEDLAVDARDQPVPAGLLLLPQADRKIRHTADLVEDDGAVARNPAEYPEALPPQLP